MSTNRITESSIEEYAIKLLEKQGFEYYYGPQIAPDSESPLRQSFDEVLLADRVKSAVARIITTAIKYTSNMWFAQSIFRSWKNVILERFRLKRNMK